MLSREGLWPFIGEDPSTPLRTGDRASNIFEDECGTLSMRMQFTASSSD
jgi:hypothetical protein